MVRVKQEAYGVDVSDGTALAMTSRTYYPKSGLLHDLTTTGADGQSRQSLRHQYRADRNLWVRYRPGMGELFAYDDLDRFTSWSELDHRGVDLG